MNPNELKCAVPRRERHVDVRAADPVEENAVLIGLRHDAAELDAFKGYFIN